MGYIWFEKRRWVIFYILRGYMPHMSVLQREINRLNRENWNWCFWGKLGLWHATHMSTWHFLWTPEMIPRSLRTFCPRRFPPWNNEFEKTWKMDLATKSQPPDCAIRSVSSREYACFHFQPMKSQDCLKINEIREKPLKSMGYICFEQRRWVIFYILRK